MHNIYQYKKTQLNTANNLKVITMLYDGAINFIRIARKRMEYGDIAGKGLYVGKVTAIVTELSTSLNMEAGGEIAWNLERLYDFILYRLVQANIKNDLKAFDDVEKVLDTLREAWKTIEKQNVQQAVNVPANSYNAGMELRV